MPIAGLEVFTHALPTPCRFTDLFEVAKNAIQPTSTTKNIHKGHCQRPWHTIFFIRYQVRLWKILLSQQRSLVNVTLSCASETLLTYFFFQTVTISNNTESKNTISKHGLPWSTNYAEIENGAITINPSQKSRTEGGPKGGAWYPETLGHIFSAGGHSYYLKTKR